MAIGTEWGRVRSMRDPSGKQLSEALPGQPVEITGLRGVPEAGDDLIVVPRLVMPLHAGPFYLSRRTPGLLPVAASSTRVGAWRRALAHSWESQHWMWHISSEIGLFQQVAGAVREL